MKYSVFAVLVLLVSFGALAKDEDDEAPAVTKDDLLAVRTITVLNLDGSFYPASAPKRLVEAIQIDVENSSDARCVGRITARFFVPGDDESSDLAYLSALPGESQNTYVVLPRPVLVDPAAIEYPDDILLFARKTGDNLNCRVTVTVYSRPGPTGPPR